MDIHSIPFMLTHIDPHSVFVIIPAYNEHSMLGTVIREILDFKYQVVVVDDGSEPSLHSIVKGLPVYLLRHRVNLGQGASLQTGIEFALQHNAEFLVTFDGDGQHKVQDVPRLLEKLITGKADIVIGSRFISGAETNIKTGRRWLLSIARYLNFIFTGVMLTDAHNGLRSFTREAASKLKFDENRMAHATEILALINKNKMRYSEEPVSIQYSEYSRAKGQTIWDSFRIVFDLLLNKIFK